MNNTTKSCSQEPPRGRVPMYKDKGLEPKWLSLTCHQQRKSLCPKKKIPAPVVQFNGRTSGNMNGRINSLMFRYMVAK